MPIIQLWKCAEIAVFLRVLTHFECDDEIRFVFFRGLVQLQFSDFDSISFVINKWQKSNKLKKN